MIKGKGLLSKLFATILCVFLAGCATGDPMLLKDPGIDIAWPPPPSPPRIKYLRSLQSPDDIVPPKGKLNKYFEFFTGTDQKISGFSLPYGVVSDGASVVYVADSSAGLIHRYDFADREVNVITQVGDHPLMGPAGVALDTDNNLYISDPLAAKVYKIDKFGNYAGEIGSAINFKRPAGIAVNRLDEKYVVDVLRNRIFVFDRNDNFLREFPNAVEGDDLNLPSNVAVDSDLNVYVTDSMNFTIKVYDHDGNLKKGIGEIGDSPGYLARPKGVAVDSDGHIYVVDAGSDLFQIFDQEGRLLLYVGGHGTAPGEFYLPSGICIDRKDRIFISDTYNRRIQMFQYVKDGVQ